MLYKSCMYLNMMQSQHAFKTSRNLVEVCFFLLTFKSYIRGFAFINRNDNRGHCVWFVRDGVRRNARQKLPCLLYKATEVTAQKNYSIILIALWCKGSNCCQKTRTIHYLKGVFSLFWIILKTSDFLKSEPTVIEKAKFQMQQVVDKSFINLLNWHWDGILELRFPITGTKPTDLS